MYRLRTFAWSCADVGVYVERKNPQEGSELLLLSRPSLRVFLPLSAFPAAHPVSRRDANNPEQLRGFFFNTNL